MPAWRAMRPTDLQSAKALESAYHTNHPERAEIGAERLRLAPDWCFVLVEADGAFRGYCFAHPWGGTLPPGLDTLLGVLPAGPDTLHLHDLVLTEHARGKGMAGPVVLRLLRQAACAGLRSATLVAVGGAGRYWSRLGFRPESDPARRRFVVESYGADCVPMQRDTATAAASAD